MPLASSKSLDANEPAPPALPAQAYLSTPLPQTTNFHALDQQPRPAGDNASATAGPQGGT